MIEIDKFGNWRWLKLINLKIDDDQIWQIWKLTMIEAYKFGNWRWSKLRSLETDDDWSFQISKLTMILIDKIWKLSQPSANNIMNGLTII